MSARVTVNPDQCERIGLLLKPLTFRSSFYARPFITLPVDRETKFRMLLLSLAICHQTHTLKNDPKNLKGWDCLEDVYTEFARQGSPLLDLSYLASVDQVVLIEQLKPLFSEDGDPSHCTLDRLEERVHFLQEAARVIGRDYEGQISILVDAAERCLFRHGQGLYERLEKLEAYADPLRKKSTCFIKFAIEAGILTLQDPENLLPIMDYHMQRVLLRTGCVEITDIQLKEMLQRREKMNSDEEIREACVAAVEILAKASGHLPAYMNDFLYPLGRSCCMEKMRCVDEVCNKNPCSFDRVIEAPEHKNCVFAGVCKGSQSVDYRNFWQPIVDTHYY